MSGRKSRNKGASYERELVNWFLEHGFFAERVPLSGATEYSKSDIDLYIHGAKGDDAPDIIIEAKRRKQLPGWLKKGFEDGANVVIMREDNGQSYVVEPLDIWFARATNGVSHVRQHST